MLIALIADVHGNREALTAVLAHAAAAGADQYVFLGDLVGYGADPGDVVDIVADCVAKGADVLKGNHDAAIEAGSDGMNGAAAAAIDWTRQALGDHHRRFLSALPMTSRQDDRLYVHAGAHRPEAWPYVTDVRQAELSLAATDARLVFVGHTHVPALFHAAPNARAQAFVPGAGVAVPLLAQRRWLVVVGSAGQPRDGSSAAAYGLYDTVSATYTNQRVGYDVDSAARKILAAGLPPSLAQRLFGGR